MEPLPQPYPKKCCCVKPHEPSTRYGHTRMNVWLTVFLLRREKPPKRRTLQSYEEVIRLYILPYPIAGEKLEEIKASHIQDWLAKLKLRGLKGNTRSNPFRRLRTALDAAVQEKLITYNPANEVEEPSDDDRRRPVVLNPDGIGRLLAALDGYHLYPLFAVAVTLGLRVSELYGLRWEDINLEARTIMVRGQLHRLKIEPDKPRKPVWENSTKTPAGEREIHYPSELGSILVAWRELQQRQQEALDLPWPHGGYVFTTQAGTPLNKDNVRRDFKKALNRAGLPDMTQHDLRHSVASIMLARGEDIEGVKEVMGHSSRAVVEDIYAHALPENKRQAGESLGFLLRQSPEERGPEEDK
jgi:integrase